jgi:hypothetical protein
MQHAVGMLRPVPKFQTSMWPLVAVVRRMAVQGAGLGRRMPPLLQNTVTGSAPQPLLKRARVGPARKPPTLGDYDTVVPRAWDTLVGLDSDPPWPLLQPFADSLTEALTKLESSRTEENLLTMDREMNLLCSVSTAVWNWKELDDPWTSARTLADVE